MSERRGVERPPLAPMYFFSLESFRGGPVKFRAMPDTPFTKYVMVSCSQGERGSVSVWPAVLNHLRMYVYLWIGNIIVSPCPSRK